MSRILPQSLALQRQLIQQLSDGNTHSGEVLAEQAGISRAAIARHITQLQSYGLDIYSIKGKGYKLSAPLQLLDAAKIRRYQMPGMAEVLLQHITDSTNSQMMKRLQEGQLIHKGAVLVAEAHPVHTGRVRVRAVQRVVDGDVRVGVGQPQEERLVVETRGMGQHRPGLVGGRAGRGAA